MFIVATVLLLSIGIVYPLVCIFFGIRSIRGRTIPHFMYMLISVQADVFVPNRWFFESGAMFFVRVQFSL